MEKVQSFQALKQLPREKVHSNAGGGAAWLPYCVSVRLRYSFGENSNVSFIGMEGSHGG